LLPSTLATIRRRATNLKVAAMPEGIIKKLTDKGFGFINTGGKKDLFFHKSAVQGVEFSDLQLGQRVSYTLAESPKGPCAQNVKPVV
jgi:cold shock protein